MELIYATEKVQRQCTSLKEAQKLFGGNKALAVSLLARVNALQQAEVLKDIVVMPTFHFHDLHHKKGRDLSGFYAIDVKSRKDAWRIILQPLDESRNPFRDTSIDRIAGIVRIVEISEVSNHYE